MENVPTGPPDVPGLLAVDHVGVAVADLDEALAFYTGVLGLSVLHREENPDQDVAEAMVGVVVPRSDPRPADPTATELQLLAPLSGRSPIARFLDRSGPGLQHVAFRVADVAVASDVLRRRGLRLLYDAARVGTRGSLINFIHPKDAGGVLVELVEVAAAG